MIVLDKFDNFWDKYKIHSGKISITISVIGGIGAILSGSHIVAGSVIIGITNLAIFFSGLAFEKLTNEFQNLEESNISLKNEKNNMISQLINRRDILKDGIEMVKLDNINNHLNQDFITNEPCDFQTPTN